MDAFQISSIFSDVTMMSFSEETRVTFESVIDTGYTLPQRGLLPGIQITFGNTLETCFDYSSIGVPAGTTAYIKVRSRRRFQVDNCIERYQYRSKEHKSVHVELEEYAVT